MGGGSCPAWLVLPPTWVLKVIFMLILLVSNDIYEILTIIIMILVKLSCFLCRFVSYAWL